MGDRGNCLKDDYNFILPVILCLFSLKLPNWVCLCFIDLHESDMWYYSHVETEVENTSRTYEEGPVGEWVFKESSLLGEPTCFGP